MIEYISSVCVCIAVCMYCVYLGAIQCQVYW